MTDTPKPAILNAAPPTAASGRLALWTTERESAERFYLTALMDKASTDLTPTEKTFLLRNVTKCLRDEELG